MKKLSLKKLFSRPAKPQPLPDSMALLSMMRAAKIKPREVFYELNSSPVARARVEASLAEVALKVHAHRLEHRLPSINLRRFVPHFVATLAPVFRGKGRQPRNPFVGPESHLIEFLSRPLEARGGRGEQMPKQPRLDGEPRERLMREAVRR